MCVIVVIDKSWYYCFMEMRNKHKTIVSIVTSLGEGGIGKIIVSGPDALSIVNKVFQGKGIADLREAASQKLYYGHIYDKGERIDEVILNVVHKRIVLPVKMREINCHGGIRVVCGYDLCSLRCRRCWLGFIAITVFQK